MPLFRNRRSRESEEEITINEVARQSMENDYAQAFPPIRVRGGDTMPMPDSMPMGGVSSAETSETVESIPDSEPLTMAVDDGSTMREMDFAIGLDNTAMGETPPQLVEDPDDPLNSVMLDEGETYGSGELRAFSGALGLDSENENRLRGMLIAHNNRVMERRYRERTAGTPAFFTDSGWTFTDGRSGGDEGHMGTRERRSSPPVIDGEKTEKSFEFSLSLDED